MTFGLRLQSRASTVKQDHTMNWDQVEGKWKRYAGSARQRWGKLTNDEWQVIGGKKDQLVGWIQEKYGIAKTDAEEQADLWSRALHRGRH
jgi:uncharacterized protein YjbJ (UPF0337 family)